MKTKLLFVFCLVLSHCFSANAQNLVPNGSFEEYSACPDDQWQINKALGWISIRNSPDYFNSCSSINYGVPNNIIGFQYPPSIGCAAYAGIFTLSGIPSYREYLGTRLDTPLTIGEKYFVSFKAVLASSEYAASNNIGVLFVTQISQQAFADPIINFSQVHSTSIISDTLNWTTIFGSFIADSSYQYIEIGNFYDDSLTQVTVPYANPYYFIDDVCVSADSAFCHDYIYTCDISGLNENISEKLHVSPNPATDYLHITSSEPFYKAMLYDLQGRCVYMTSQEEKNLTVDVSRFAIGSYILKIQMQEKVSVIKILIQ